MFNPELIWQWATATLSPTSVILFLVAITSAFWAWWFLKELRKADLRLVEASNQSVNRLKEELTKVKGEHRGDLHRLHELELKQKEMEYELKLARMELANMKEQLAQANATIAAFINGNIK